MDPKAGVLCFSHDLTRSFNIVTARLLGCCLFFLGQEVRGGLSELSSSHTPTRFHSSQFQELPFPKPHCLVGYPQNSLWFLLVLSAQPFSGSPPPLSVVKLRGFGAITKTTSCRQRGKVVTSCQRIPRNLGIGVESWGCLQNGAAMSGRT